MTDGGAAQDSFSGSARAVECGTTTQHLPQSIDGIVVGSHERPQRRRRRFDQQQPVAPGYAALALARRPLARRQWRLSLLLGPDSSLAPAPLSHATINADMAANLQLRRHGCTAPRAGVNLPSVFSCAGGAARPADLSARLRGRTRRPIYGAPSPRTQDGGTVRGSWPKHRQSPALCHPHLDAASYVTVLYCKHR